MSGLCAQSIWSLVMLLPFDLRADREGWTVLEVETDRPAVLEGEPLTGLCLDHAEDAVNALNKLEIACQRTARMMLDPRLLATAQPARDYARVNHPTHSRRFSCPG